LSNVKVSSHIHVYPQDHESPLSFIMIAHAFVFNKSVIDDS
jgi:hypothetical protein